MHNLQLTEDQEMVVDTVRKLVSDDVAPKVQELDEHRTFVREWFDGLAELGVYALSLAEEKGHWPVSKLIREKLGQETFERGYYTSSGAGAYPDVRKKGRAKAKFSAAARASLLTKVKGGGALGRTV